MFRPDEMIAAYVDGPNFHATARTLDIDVDYRRLRKLLNANDGLLRASYFTPVIESEDHVAVRPLIDWLQYNGWTVVTRASRELKDDDGRRRFSGHTEIDLAVAAMKAARHVDHFVLFTGNGNFTSLVRALQDHGRRVTVVSSIRAAPANVSDGLRRQADQFVDLDDLRSAIERPDRRDRVDPAA